MQLYDFMQGEDSRNLLQENEQLRAQLRKLEADVAEAQVLCVRVRQLESELTATVQHVDLEGVEMGDVGSMAEPKMGRTGRQLGPSGELPGLLSVASKLQVGVKKERRDAGERRRERDAAIEQYQKAAEMRDDIERDMLYPTAEKLRQTQNKFNALERLALKDRECPKCRSKVSADHARIALVRCKCNPEGHDAPPDPCEVCRVTLGLPSTSELVFAPMQP